MDKIIDIIKSVISGKLVPVLAAAVTFLCKLLDFSEKIYDDKKQQDQKKAESEANKDLKDACDNGSLDDLLDATQKKGNI